MKMKRTGIIVLACLLALLNVLQYNFILSNTRNIAHFVSNYQLNKCNELNFARLNDDRSVHGIKESNQTDINNYLTIASLLTKKSIKFILIKSIHAPSYSPFIISQEQLSYNFLDVINLFCTERFVLNNLVVIRI